MSRSSGLRFKRLGAPSQGFPQWPTFVLRFASTLTAAVPPGILTRLSIIPIRPKWGAAPMGIRTGAAPGLPSASGRRPRKGGRSAVSGTQSGIRLHYSTIGNAVCQAFGGAAADFENIPRNLVDKTRRVSYALLKSNRYSQCAPKPKGFSGRIGNPV